MKQDPACTWSLCSLTAASSSLQESKEPWSFWGLSLWGPLGVRVPELPAHLFHAFLERRRKDECHQGGTQKGTAAK